MSGPRRKGPWSPDETERFLGEFQGPVRLACNGTSGHPVLASLWYRPEDGKRWCATQRTASVVSHLTRDPRCAFEISVESPPYCGVRGPGVAQLYPGRGEEVLRLLIDRYLEDSESPLADFLLSRVANETAIAIEPQTIYSWDYRERMGDAA